MGKIVASVLFGFAEIETDYIREWQTKGIALAKEWDRYQSRKKGSTKSQPNRAIALRAKGLKLAEIATASGVSTATVYRYLGST